MDDLITPSTLIHLLMSTLPILLFTLLLEGLPPFIRIESPLSIVSFENNILFPKVISVGCSSSMKPSTLYIFQFGGNSHLFIMSIPLQWLQLVTISTLWKSRNPSTFFPFKRVTTLSKSYNPLKESLLYFIYLCSFLLHSIHFFLHSYSFVIFIPFTLCFCVWLFSAWCIGPLCCFLCYFHKAWLISVINCPFTISHLV